MNAAYYNDNDPDVCAWLRELARRGLIMDGEIDNRSILDVEAKDLEGFTRHHFFSGIGGWDYALQLAGWPEDRPVATASLPCQPFSEAGRQLGKADNRHLLPHFLALVRGLGFETIFGEQVPGAIRHGWLDDLCDEMDREGYAVRAAVLTAAGAGAPHIRQRLFWMANSDNQRPQRRARAECADQLPVRANGMANWTDCEWLYCRDGKARPINPSIKPLVNGLSKGMVRGRNLRTQREAEMSFIEVPLVNGNSKRPLYGIGINDAAYQVQPIINGRRVICPYYRKWVDMLKRCYSDKHHKQFPTYKGCTVCKEWLKFSVFKKWMSTQEWQGMQLDKDILHPGNKEYSPNNCCFVTNRLNNLFGMKSKSNELPVGVHFEKQTGKYRVFCTDSDGVRKSIGRFASIDLASKAYECHKNSVIRDEILLQSNIKIINALTRLLPIDADNTQEARVMRLKGYGNAIVPQVAAEFIRASL